MSSCLKRWKVALFAIAMILMSMPSFAQMPVSVRENPNIPELRNRGNWEDRDRNIRFERIDRRGALLDSGVTLEQINEGEPKEIKISERKAIIDDDGSLTGFTETDFDDRGRPIRITESAFDEEGSEVGVSQTEFEYKSDIESSEGGFVDLEIVREYKIEEGERADQPHKVSVTSIDAKGDQVIQTTSKEVDPESGAVTVKLESIFKGFEGFSFGSSLSITSDGKKREITFAQLKDGEVKQSRTFFGEVLGVFEVNAFGGDDWLERVETELGDMEIAYANGLPQSILLTQQFVFFNTDPSLSEPRIIYTEQRIPLWDISQVDISINEDGETPLEEALVGNNG